MKALLCALAALTIAPSVSHAQAAASIQDKGGDPFQWLEDIDAPKAMAWVEGQNVKSAKRLEGDKRTGCRDQGRRRFGAGRPQGARGGAGPDHR